MNNKFKFFSGLLACTLLSSVFTFSPKAAEVDAEPQKKDTELVFVVDRSGSMRDSAEDTIGSFNSVIEEQKKPDKKGDVYVTTVMFNHKSKKIHDRKNIKDINNLTREEYHTSGSTALLDAVGSTITDLSKSEAVKNNKVMFVIITDGYENSSKEFKKSQVKKLIDEKTNKENWQFIFLGANIDSARESQSLGIASQFSRDFETSHEGIRKAFSHVNTAINQVRNGEKVDLEETKFEKDLEPKELKK